MSTRACCDMKTYVCCGPLGVKNQVQAINPATTTSQKIAGKTEAMVDGARPGPSWFDVVAGTRTYVIVVDAVRTRGESRCTFLAQNCSSAVAQLLRRVDCLRSTVGFPFAAVHRAGPDQYSRGAYARPPGLLLPPRRSLVFHLHSSFAAVHPQLPNRPAILRERISQVYR